jgi:hypothetical protein
MSVALRPHGEGEVARGEHGSAMAMVLHYEGEEKASEALPRRRADKGNG